VYDSAATAARPCVRVAQPEQRRRVYSSGALSADHVRPRRTCAACHRLYSRETGFASRRPHPCPGLSGFTCSTLVLPLDYTGRRPGSLRLQIAAADRTAAPRGGLLVIAGGPGQPGVPFAARISKAIADALSDYRLAMYDQRGTGGGALDCPELQEIMGSSDLYPPPAGAVRVCARTIGATRVFYGTDDVVVDMELLRQALGADKWTLDGISYGTFVGERYAIAHPKRVNRLVLDSVVPHNAGFELLPIQLRAAGRVLRLECGAGCVSDLTAVVRQRHNGPRLLDALALMSIVDPKFHSPRDLADALHRARRGDLSGLNDLLQTVRRWNASPAEELSQGLHASALCADWRFPWGDSQAPIPGRGAELARAAARLRPRNVAPFDRATATGNGIEQECLPWSPTRPTPSAARRLPRVPTLLLNGDRDLSTPLEWARREVAITPAGRLVVVHGAGHSVQMRATSDAGRRAVLDFLTR
jgi:pimeloyl-ACP methyl ester carboxylesterase